MSESFEKAQNLKEVPQLSLETNVSYDYRNEYGALMSYLMMGKIEKVRELFEGGYRMREYEEVYLSSVYEDVVNEKNESTVQRINELANTFNEKAGDSATTKEDFLAIFNELEELIKGKKS